MDKFPDVEDTNPYAPPSVTHPDGRLSTGHWLISGKSLWFQDGGRLPEIDLFGGEDGELQQTQREFKAPWGNSGWAAVFFVCAVVAGPMLAQPLRAWIPSHVAEAGVVVIAIGGVLVIGNCFSKKAKLVWYQRAGTRRRRGWYWVWLVTAFSVTAAWVWDLVGSAGIGFMAGAVVMGVMARVLARWGLVLRCRREDGGWFEIAGISKEVLEILKLHQRDQLPRRGRNRQWKKF